MGWMMILTRTGSARKLRGLQTSVFAQSAGKVARLHRFAMTSCFSMKASLLVISKILAALVELHGTAKNMRWARQTVTKPNGDSRRKIS